MYKDFYDLYIGLFDQSISESDFQNNIIANFASTEEALTFHGLCQFFTYLQTTFGEDHIIKSLSRLGYSDDLQNERSRVFALSIHSDQ